MGCQILTKCNITLDKLRNHLFNSLPELCFDTFELTYAFLQAPVSNSNNPITKNQADSCVTRP